MKAVILCGGRGGRMFSSETKYLPKPLVPIGNKPMVQRLMDYYGGQGIEEFILALGYKANMINQAFLEYKDWPVSRVFTGDPDVCTGGRLKNLADAGYLGDRFLLSYCDVISSISVEDLIAAHEANSGLVTAVVTNPALPYGVAEFDDDSEIGVFSEKPVIPSLWANEGVYIVESSVIQDWNDSTVFETDVLPFLAAERGLFGLRHYGTWISVNTTSDWKYVNELWEAGKLYWLGNS